MFVYKDVNYVNYICSLDISTGLKLYKQCLSRLQEQKDQIWDDRLWELYINRSEDQKDISFEEYKKRQLSDIKNKIETENMTSNDKDLEEERIINENKIIDIGGLNKNGYKKNVNQRRITKIIKK